MKRLKNELQKFKTDLNPLEQVFIIAVRLLMIVGIILNPDTVKRNLMLLNLLGTFTCEIMHFFTPEKSFINKISYKINVHFSFFVLMGSFFGHYYCLYEYIDKYDWILHSFAGASAVFVGYYFAKPLVTVKTRKDNALLTLFGFLFSNFGLAFWEITEFWSDFYLGSQNQAYCWKPEADLWIIEMFGFGENFKQQYPLFDTMIDMTLAFITALIASVALYVWLRCMMKKRETLRNKAKLEEIHNI